MKSVAYILSNPLFEPVYTIGHAAKKLGVATPTLRMYEKAGLILLYHTSTNRRLFSRHDIEHLNIIKELIRKRHLNIQAIRHIAALIPCWDIKSCVEENRQNCSAYYDNSNPCWLQSRRPLCFESTDKCRMCEVYVSYPQIIKNPKKLLNIFAA